MDAIRETEGAGTYADDISHSDVECNLNVMASTSKRFHFLLLISRAIYHVTDITIHQSFLLYTLMHYYSLVILISSLLLEIICIILHY